MLKAIIYNLVKTEKEVQSMEQFDKMMLHTTSEEGHPTTYINGGVIATRSIYANSIQVGAIQADHIRSGSIVSDHISTQGITADNIKGSRLESMNSVSEGGSMIDLDNGSFIMAGGNISWNNQTKAFTINATNIQIGNNPVLNTSTDLAKQINNGVTRISGNALHFDSNVSMNAAFIEKLVAQSAFIQYLDSKEINADLIKSGTLEADHIKGGTLDFNLLHAKHFSADNITSGTINASIVNIDNLSASRIKTGRIQDSLGRNDLNLDNGTFRLANGNIEYNGTTLTIKAGVQFAALPTDTQSKINAGAAAKTLTDTWVEPGTTHINGDNIRTGTLSANNGVSTLNMNTGDMVMNGNFNLGAGALQWNKTTKNLSIKANTLKIGSYDAASKNDVSTSLSSAKNYTEQAIQDIEIGGRNLILNSESVNTQNVLSARTSSIVLTDMRDEWGFEKAYRFKLSNSPNSYTSVWTSSGKVSEDMKFDQVYTHSLYVKNVGNKPFIVRQNGLGSQPSVVVPVGFSGRLSFTGTRRANYDWYQIHFTTQNLGEEIEFITGRQQLEKGNKETDWTPAPEDVQSQIDSRPTFQDFDKTNIVTINGGNIKAGTISSKNNYSRINLDDGTFSFGNGRLVWNGSDMTVNGKISVSNINGDIPKSKLASSVQTEISAGSAANTTVNQNKSKWDNVVNKQNADSRLDNIVSSHNMPYTKDIIVYGDSNKFYPVYVRGGNQDLFRTIKIWRQYGERGPNNWHTGSNSNTHKGSLMLTWKGNFGGWGGATYREFIEENTSSYATLLADCFRSVHSMAYTFMLKGGGSGGAIYHMASDQNLNQVEIYYNGSSDIVYPNSNASYVVRAETPRTTINTTRLEELKLAKSKEVIEADSKATNAKTKTDAWSYNGTTEIDGKSIKTGTLSANQITTGTLKSQNNNSWLNLNNGEFNFANNGLVYSGGNLTLNGKLSVSNLDGAIPKSKLDTTTQNQINAGNTAKSTLDSKASTWDAKETTSGAQAKANTAEANAKELASAMAFGKMLYTDPTFKYGNNSVSAYNNSGGTGVTIARIAKQQNAPTDSTHILRVTTSTAATSPGLGGFSFQTMTSVNKTYITRFIAKIPSGRSVIFASNATGSGGNYTRKWLSSNQGTGRWEEYVYKVTAGDTGSFSSTNFFYISGGSKPLTWYIAYATVFDVTDDDLIAHKTNAWSYNGTTEIDGKSIKTGTINANRIEARTITADRIVSSSLTANEIASNAIQSRHISTGSITADKIVMGTGTPSSGNLAAGKTFSGSYSGTIPGNGNNTVGTTYASFGAGGSNNNQAESSYVQVDLGSTRQIAESRIFWYAADRRRYYYKIKYSTNGSTWFYAIGNSNSNGWTISKHPSSGSSGSYEPTIDRFSIPITARYLRIYGNGSTSNTGNHIYEWELYSKIQTTISGGDIVANTLDVGKITGDKANFLTLSFESLNSNMKLNSGAIRIQNSDGDFATMNTIPEFRSQDSAGTAAIMGKGRSHYYSGNQNRFYIGSNLDGLPQYGVHIGKNQTWGIYRPTSTAGGSPAQYYNTPKGWGAVQVVEELMRRGLVSNNFNTAAAEIRRLNGWGNSWPVLQPGEPVMYKAAVAGNSSGVERIWTMGTSSDGVTTRVYSHVYHVFEKGTTGTSDRRLKHDIEPTQVEALRHIESLTFKEFKWNKDNRYEPLGLIAQDSGIIRVPDDEMEGYDIQRAIMLGLKGVQELQEIVKEQAEEIKRLKEIIDQ